MTPGLVRSRPVSGPASSPGLPWHSKGWDRDASQTREPRAHGSRLSYRAARGKRLPAGRSRKTRRKEAETVGDRRVAEGGAWTGDRPHRVCSRRRSSGRHKGRQTRSESPVISVWRYPWCRQQNVDAQVMPSSHGAQRVGRCHREPWTPALWVSPLVAPSRPVSSEGQLRGGHLSPGGTVPARETQRLLLQGQDPLCPTHSLGEHKWVIFQKEKQVRSEVASLMPVQSAQLLAHDVTKARECGSSDIIRDFAARGRHPPAHPRSFLPSFNHTQVNLRHNLM